MNNRENEAFLKYKTVDGVDVPLTSAEKLALVAMEDIWRANKGKRVKALLDKLNKPDYGTIEEQFLYAVENGFEELRQRNLIIKNNYNL